MRPGSFEREVASWMHELRMWFHRHERFTWITLVLAIAPSPVAAMLAVLLGSLQLILCLRGKIPTSEKNLLILALILGTANLLVSVIVINYLARQGWTLLQTLHPFWWLTWFSRCLPPVNTI